jgi:periplasmic protein TonB
MRSILCAMVAASVMALAAAPMAQDVQVYDAGRGVSLPRVKTQVKADYTDEAKAAGIAGTVTLSTVVLADGRVGDIEVVKSLDAVLGLDQQAVKAMKQWTFAPGEKDGKPVAVRVAVEMTFTLK